MARKGSGEAAGGTWFQQHAPAVRQTLPALSAQCRTWGNSIRLPGPPGRSAIGRSSAEQFAGPGVLRLILTRRATSPPKLLQPQFPKAGVHFLEMEIERAELFQFAFLEMLRHSGVGFELFEEV